MKYGNILEHIIQNVGTCVHQTFWILGNPTNDIFRKDGHRKMMKIRPRISWNIEFVFHIYQKTWNGNLVICNELVQTNIPLHRFQLSPCADLSIHGRCYSICTKLNIRNPRKNWSVVNLNQFVQNWASEIHGNSGANEYRICAGFEYRFAQMHQSIVDLKILLQNWASEILVQNRAKEYRPAQICQSMVNVNKFAQK